MTLFWHDLHDELLLQDLTLCPTLKQLKHRLFFFTRVDWSWIDNLINEEHLNCWWSDLHKIHWFDDVWKEVTWRWSPPLLTLLRKLATSTILDLLAASPLPCWSINAASWSQSGRSVHFSDIAHWRQDSASILSVTMKTNRSSHLSTGRPNALSARTHSLVLSSKVWSADWPSFFRAGWLKRRRRMALTISRWLSYRSVKIAADCRLQILELLCST